MRTPRIFAHEKSHKGSTTLPREILLRTKGEVQVFLTNFLQFFYNVATTVFTFIPEIEIRLPELTVLAREYETLWKPQTES
jgi:hypothetical protein